MTLPVKDATGATVNLETRTGTSTFEQPTHNITTEAGAGQTIGATGDAAITTNATGSLSGKLRGLVGLLAAAIDITNGFIKAQLKPFTSGGTSTFHLITAATTNANFIKNSPGQIYGYQIYNNAAYPIYVKFFDKASAPTVGTDTPIKTIGVPAGGGNNFHTDIGIQCINGIAYCVVKGITVADATAVALSDAAMNVDYK